MRKRTMVFVTTLIVCLVLMNSSSVVADNNLNIGINNVSGRQNIQQISLENCTIVFPSSQGYQNSDVLQLYNPSESEYSAILKSQAEEYVPNGMLTSFSSNALRGWSSSAGYQYVLFGRYYQDYIDQPILWRVLGVTNGRALLLSELILDTRSFDSSSNVWEKSDLRTWLNGDFIDKAFSQNERNAIIDNGEVGRVFLLSDAELTNASYGFNTSKYEPDRNRSASGSMYAYTNNLWNVKDSDYTNYYARSRPNDQNVDLVTSSGKIMLAKITRDNVGVRPAVWVNVNMLPFTNGEGSLLYPFQ